MIGEFAKSIGIAGLAGVLAVQAQGAWAIEPPGEDQRARQMEAFQADAPGSILRLQPFRAAQTVQGADGAALTLTSLNPYVNSWFLLEREPDGGARQVFHLENAAPETWEISLTEDEGAPALLIADEGERHLCRPWTGDQSDLAAARDSGLPYAPLCDGRLYLRNEVAGSRTSREAVAEFLREHVLFGESIVGMIKGVFYEDAFMESGDTMEGADAGAVAASLGRADLDRRPVMRASMGFDLVGAEGGGMEAGSWYAVEDAPGVYASAMQPGMISEAILRREGETNWLDSVERRADVYLAAFDLEMFEVGYELGTDHPGLEWSPRPHGAGRDWNTPGPDGIDSPAPLMMTGMLSPALTDRVAATFTGGFKRSHGAFRYGDYATFNHGHHYGFVVNGTVLSRLQPNLSTLYVLNDGTIGMRTWTEEDAALLPDIRFARQNGVPLIAPDPETGAGVPGPLVRHWGPGNWSGSANADLRTLRAGACMRTVEDRQFLIYAYFSTATPSAMARTFQSYGCDYAMLLDMNSLEHTYLAVYTPAEDGLETEHLVERMGEIDARERDGTRIPRFVGFSDNRDFFYLLRR